MAARNFAQMQALTRDLVLIPGSFAPNGSGAVSATSRKGLGWSVARTSAGLFTVTFTDKYAELIAFNPTLQLATPGDQTVHAGVYVAASKTITINVWDASDAAAADIAADANNRINFLAVFRNSSATPVRG